MSLLKYKPYFPGKFNFKTVSNLTKFADNGKKSVCYNLYATPTRGFTLPEKETSKDVAALIPSMIIGSILKALFMSVSIVMIILPTFGTNLPAPMIKVASGTFSVTQLITALIGGALACVIWPIIKTATKNLR